MVSALLENLYRKMDLAPDAVTVARIILSVALMLLGGFLMTRLTKRLRLPNVTAYIVAGILLGPFCLGAVPREIIAGMDFLSDIALAFIAFGVGEFFRFSTLKRCGAKVVVITVAEALGASLVVFLVTFLLLRLDFAFSIVLSALASATAPASTMMTIRQTGAKGDFVDTLLLVVALDDVVGLVAYSVSVAVAKGASSGGFSAGDIALPIVKNLGAILLGILFGFLLKWLIPEKRSTDNRLIISVCVLFLFCGICSLFGVSPLLGCMVIGTVYINTAGDEKLFYQLNYFSPPILLLFFVRSGLNFDLNALFSENGNIGAVPLFAVGIVYFAVRILGKYAGSFAGCLLTKKDRKVRDYLGLALIPQAGVAIGLAALGARELGGEAGVALNTIILSSSVLYELIGPACAKLSLYLSGSYSDEIEKLAPVPETDKNGKKKSEAEILIERIAKIRAEIEPIHRELENREERAFTEAAQEQAEAFYARNPFVRRRRP